MVKEATAKFEREMMLHAEDIAALQKVKGQLEETQEAIKAAESTAHSARSELEMSRSSWETQKRSLEQEIEKLNTRSVIVQTKPWRGGMMAKAQRVGLSTVFFFL